MQTIRTLALIALLISCYYFVYYLFLGITNPIPGLGDSWDYHIPISISILDGSFINPPCYAYYPRFYPGSSEAINSLLILLHIPLTISNLLAIIVLFFCCYKLGLVFHLQRYFALLFALTFATLTAVVRWANAVSIDVWMVVWFLIGIILLENPKKNFMYFVKLGFVLGMMIGTKYTGLVYLLFLLIFYGKKLFKFINLCRIVGFSLTFFIFGLFWYLRNYLAIHNPIIPSCFINSLACVDMHQTLYLWQELFRHPLLIIDSFFGEYKLWIFSPIIITAYFLWKKKTKKIPQRFTTIAFLGLLNLVFYFSLPTSPESWQTVSTIRYTLPAFALIILAVFMLAQVYKKEVLLGYLVIANMLPMLSMTYYPKLVLFYLPIALLIIYFLNKKQIKF